MQVAQPEIPKADMGQQVGGGVVDSHAADEGRASSQLQKSFHTPLTLKNRARKPTSPGSASHRTVWSPELAEVRTQHQHHRTGSNLGSEIFQSVHNGQKMGQLPLYCFFFFRIPQPRVTGTFHLTPCLDATPHNVTQPAIDRLGRGSWIEETMTH